MSAGPGEPVGVRPGPGPVAAWRPRPYSQLLRGPTFRWWRPLLSILAGVGATLVLLLGLGVAYVVLQYASGLDPLGGASSGTSSGTASDAAEAWFTSPLGFLWSNLLLAAFVPLAMVAVWAGYGWRPRWVASVVPGIRWGWLLRCGLVSLVVIAVSVVGLELLDGYTWTPERDWVWLLVVVGLSTPLQAAGEEYLFRGWIPQLVGSMIPSAAVGALVGGLLSSTLFAIAHGQQNVWLFADRFAFGAVASWLVWRTGGLEAGIALHATNNLVALMATIGSGDLRDTVEITDTTATYLLIDLATLAVAVAGILLLARRRPVVRLFTPPLPPPPPDPYRG